MVSYHSEIRGWNGIWFGDKQGGVAGTAFGLVTQVGHRNCGTKRDRVPAGVCRVVPSSMRFQATRISGTKWNSVPLTGLLKYQLHVISG